MYNENMQMHEEILEMQRQIINGVSELWITLKKTNEGGVTLS